MTPILPSTTATQLSMGIYIFQGNDGEQVPETVEKLIVEEGVEELPKRLCVRYQRLRQVWLPRGLTKINNQAFSECPNLSEVNIPCTVEYIGDDAFVECFRLKKLEFENSTASPSQLRTIESCAFDYCNAIERIKLPSSVNFLGWSAFGRCFPQGTFSGLMEANLSSTSITTISRETFVSCQSLQIVCLPKTLEYIGLEAFKECFNLVTVLVPLGSKPIKIGHHSFLKCRQLANLVLPKGSTAENDSFEDCTTLHGCFGSESSDIVAGLMDRFAGLPVHEMCYDHSSPTPQDLRQCIVNHGDSLLVDKFGMSPLHILCSTIEPKTELLEVLLDLLPYQMVKWKDGSGKRALEYLIRNWTDHTKILFQRTVQKWMIDPLVRCGAAQWGDTIECMMQAVLASNSHQQRETSWNKSCSHFVHFENIQATSMLEMALWKAKLKSGATTNHAAKRQALDRKDCRFWSGSNVVIPSVATFLDISRPRSND